MYLNYFYLEHIMLSSHVTPKSMLQPSKKYDTNLPCKRKLIKIFNKNNKKLSSTENFHHDFGQKCTQNFTPHADLMQIGGN